MAGASYSIGDDGKMQWDFEGDRLSFAERAGIDLKFNATAEALGTLSTVCNQLNDRSEHAHSRLEYLFEYLGEVERRVIKLEQDNKDLQVRLGDVEENSYN